MTQQNAQAKPSEPAKPTEPAKNAGPAEPTDPASQANPTILSLLADWANLCTIAGVVSGLLGIYFAAQGKLQVSAAMGVIAVVLDCFDGPIARSTKNRPAHMPPLGLQLDSLADAICSGVGPAVLVLAVGDWNSLLLVPAALIVVAGVTRLAYFNVYGLSGGKFSGMPIFYNPVVVALVLLVLWAVAPGAAVGGAAVAGFAVAILNVAPFTVPKLRGRFLKGFLVFCFAQTAVLFVYAAQGIGS
ncbi:CDP-alcohol phosphatidyltransferase [Actinobacteria bacterium OK074]|nr:CDP-alcohol phosphatidyltransferase [Actinobacteria bacterium OK074]